MLNFKFVKLGIREFLENGFGVINFTYGNSFWALLLQRELVPREDRYVYKLSLCWGGISALEESLAIEIEEREGWFEWTPIFLWFPFSNEQDIIDEVNRLVVAPDMLVTRIQERGSAHMQEVDEAIARWKEDRE